MPSFNPGETTILFVEQSARFNTVLGLSQGKFSISNGTVANSVSDLAFADGKSPREIRMSIEDFKKQIRATLERR
jgi:hypothetical protein